MNSATLLEAHDRCPRLAHWSQRWKKNSVHPLALLYESIEAAMEYDGPDDPGQFAGDTLMGTAVERSLEINPGDQFGAANHYASLADILTFVIRTEGPWKRPCSKNIGEQPWVSSAFLDASETQLRRIVVVDHWTESRKLAECHSWRTIGEVCAYQMPMRLTIFVLGSSQKGRRHGAWSKGWLHPLNSNLRIRKRSGESFTGAWKPIFREDVDFNRESWVEQMAEDGVISDALLEVEVPVPEQEICDRILGLAERKLKLVRETTETPMPSPSVCDWPFRCAFADCCWNFVSPSNGEGYIQIT